MMIVLLAEHASMNVQLKQYLKAISIKLIRMFALTVVHVLMFALLRQFILNSIIIEKNERLYRRYGLFLFYTSEIQAGIQTC